MVWNSFSMALPIQEFSASKVEYKILFCMRYVAAAALWKINYDYDQKEWLKEHNLLNKVLCTCFSFDILGQLMKKCITYLLNFLRNFEQVNEVRPALTLMSFKWRLIWKSGNPNKAETSLDKFKNRWPILKKICSH